MAGYRLLRSQLMEGSVMPDRYALADIAQRIAATENRVHQLRDRVGRLQQEGSDAHRERHLLASLSGSLGELYSRQSAMRRTGWIRF
jgi:hypothetical protein